MFGHLKTSPSWGEVPFLCPKILTDQGLGLLQNALFANACSTSSTVTANQFKGKNVLFFVSAVTCGICRAQLMELNEVWDTLVNEDVNIYVFTHGDQKDKKFVNEFMDLKFEVNMLDDFSFPKKLGLVNSDKGITSISRGYAIIVDGNIIEPEFRKYDSLKT
ncbi:peroxiredoxin family protein [Thermobacillus composti]|uniref:peroxiredoxin family protein n=1 Tax=Thermobacillus composti TaxID=377615 RepID=UPI0009FEC50C|nr:redoxin family protein [Thermobacillus composti]